MLSNYSVNVQSLDLQAITKINVRAAVLRLDKIHPVVSGNKWFKLKYYLQDALQNNYQTVLTFGGAWSNHIIATAYACRDAGMHSIGVIRGEQSLSLSTTLQSALGYGMQLEFVDRHTFQARDKTELVKKLVNKWGRLYIIPEGGAGIPGIRGSEEILASIPYQKYSHIMCCIGTGTMFMGVVNSSLPTQELIGIPVLKGMGHLPEQFREFFKEPARMDQCKVLYDYHFGGYAKKTPGLIQFMNQFHQQTGIPTDFVYTAKLMFAFTDLLEKNYFTPDSHILIIHSGGLQGNTSLKPGTLAF
ncbi:MAG: pyridoxal-phosphate dependent enzyme [Chitinophagaceae bacterium]